MKQLLPGIKNSSIWWTLFCSFIINVSYAQQLCSPVGWATENGGTTGGGNASSVTVTNLSDFQNAAKASGAKVIYVSGTMGSGVSTRVSVSSDKTIFGLPGAKLVGGIDVKGANNVIIRNLTIQGPGAVDVDGVDCMVIDNSTNVWLDHLDIYDGQDGNMDIVNGANYITVTYCKFSYTSASQNHQFSNLIGNSDSKTSDRGKLKVTLQYNWWADGVKERMPRVRFGQVHVVNNLFNSNTSSNVVRAGREADLLIESNVFSGVKKPIDLYENDFTAVTARNNIFTNTSGNTSGSGTSFSPSYDLEIIPASEVEAVVKSGAGATLTTSSCDTPPSNQLPTVSITSPANNTSFNAPASINIQADASDEDGSISKIEFYNGNDLLGSDNSSPFNYNWTNVSSGNYIITARATDNVGAVATSSVVNITVNATNNQSPVVSITSPANSSVHTAPASINLQASASDPDGSITKVDFYNGNSFLGSDNSAPFTFNWANVAAGTYSVTAKATDNNNNVTTSSIISIVVNSSTNDCDSPVKYGLVGYATLAGGTTGGQGGASVTVSTGTDLQNAIKNKGNEPLIIYVNGTITPENSPGLTKIDIKDVTDISIIGVGTSGEFNGIGIKVMRASNIIIQNIKVHHVLIGDKDCISIEGPAHHIWVDHCELYNQYQGVGKDDYDGLLDAKAESEYITFSWNYLHDSWKASLAGSSESDTYDRKITYHHNFFENINSRLPLFRGGNGHVFNNYYKSVESTGINARLGACLKIENNYFENVNNPYVTAYSDVDGAGDLSGNVLVNSPFKYSSDERELPSCVATIPYNYNEFLNDASMVPAIVQQYAGVGKLDITPDCPGTQYTITLTLDGSGSVSKTPHQSSYDAGSTVSVSATPIAGWVFTGWSGTASSTENPLNVTVNSDLNITANFEQVNTNFTVIQAEEACDFQGILESTNGGFNGSSYVNTENLQGSNIQWSLNVPSSGTYSLDYRYANSGNSSRPVKILVNGSEQIASEDFAPTGAWTTWLNNNIELNLMAGDNLIEFVSLTEEGASNIDQFTINSTAAYSGSCVLTNTISSKTFKVICYPNPFNKELVVSVANKFSYLLSDARGMILESGSGIGERTIGQNLPVGVYILQITSDTGSEILKIVKE